MTVFSMTFYDIFQTKLHSFTKLMMLFPAVLMNFPYSKVCLIGEWSIYVKKYTFQLSGSVCLRRIRRSRYVGCESSKERDKFIQFSGHNWFKLFSVFTESLIS